MDQTDFTADHAAAPDFGVAEIHAHHRQIERRDLWARGNTVVVVLGLTAILVSFSVSLLLKGTKTFLGINLTLAVQALIVFVPAFNLYMIYQHFRLRGVQRQLAENQIQAEVFRRMAMFDPLTGLYNRRYAEQRLQAEIDRSQRHGLPFSIVLLDLNGFKQINDAHGHPIGDLVLNEFARCLNSAIRGSDLAVRWGGDEFMLLLVDCNLSQIRHVLLRLAPFDVSLDGRTVRVSFAAGWKEYTRGEGVGNLLDATDRQLYINKLAMKNTEHRVPTVV
jgi:diguanylate cyclase (GGDEF)-like protein